MQAADPKRVYLLRSCDHDFSNRDCFAWDDEIVFRWPTEIGAELRADHWTSDLSCGEGDGLHGFVGGEGITRRRRTHAT